MYKGSKFLVTWNTNDLNIPVGVRFNGVDNITNSKITCWSGPYSSASPSTFVSVPSNQSYVTYKSFQLMLYPFSGTYINSLESNIQTTNQLFDSMNISPNISVIRPDLNTTIRIYNPGTIQSFLHIAEICIYSTEGYDLAKSEGGAVALATSSQPFQNDISSWGPQNAVDKNPTTAFRGGYDLSVGPDITSFIQISLSPSVINTTASISSIVITGSTSPNLTLAGMKFLITNTFNGVLCSNTKTLTDDIVQTFSFT
jgi:hypothetical protein